MSVKISSHIDTKNTADKYATHLGNLTKGGVHTKDSIAKMNSIPVERRVRMMLCVVADVGDGTPGLYWLNTPVNPTQAQLADNNYWEPVPLGVNIDSLLSLQGFENASALTIQDGIGDIGDAFIVDIGGSVNDPNIFGGQAVTLNVGDYLVYGNNAEWKVVPVGAQSVTWATLTGKPSTFPPTSHTHVINDITDFPDLSSYLTQTSVVSQITDITDPTKIPNVAAIKQYFEDRSIYIVNDITARDALTKFEDMRVIVLDASGDTFNGLTSGAAEYVQDSDHPNADPEGYVFIPGSNNSFNPDTSGDGNKFLGDSSTVYQYVKGIYKVLNIPSHTFVVDDVLARSGSNYVLSTNENLLPLGVVVEVIDANNVLLWIDGFSNKFTGLTPDTKYYIGNDGKVTSNNSSGRLVYESVSTTEAYFSKTVNTNLLENNSSGSSTQSIDGTLAIDFNGIRKHTLTLDANVTTLTINNLPPSAEFIPVILRIEQNATIGYSISTVANLENAEGVNPPIYSTTAGENTEWYIYKTATGIRIDAVSNVA